MKKSLSILLCIFSFTAVALSQEQTQTQSKEWQEEQLADIKKRIEGKENEPTEKVFQNIEILKGKPASRLPGMMSALTGLLGVSCNYCHIPGHWEAEDKPAKQIARQHFKLIGQVNTDYFKGENKVSCWTCHRGEPKAPLLPPAK
jgi:hypothetical protein